MYRFHSDNFHWLGFLKPDWKFCWEVSHKKNVHTMICLVEDPYQKHSLFMVISSGFLLPTKQYENEEWQQGSLSWQLSKKRIICLTRLLLQIVQSPFQTLERRQKQAGGSQLSGQTVFLSHSALLHMAPKHARGYVHFRPTMDGHPGGVCCKILGLVG